ncbi:MAG: Ni/Fe hydrogenase subunit alpha [Hamadaea sp.]|uniref:Ni/Fe hydrogenase subunit alpha n=1 Tax=Hamadaea sp. TaxID=2024425 RepID=UPI0017B61D78|nr:Ni/Fe hydrogenase subunit alpha [Hamadaea sp.]NUT18846.1 Ni/Fe hydrogenase subunit alpha [Hamadaea sp.]
MTHRHDRVLRVDALARVEGEGALHIHVRDGKVGEVQLEIYEPPRFFEAFLAGRDYAEAPDITARICGICPVAYQMSACQAMEDAVGITVGGAIGKLRRLLYCGEWISSHALHIYLLHAPDFLGFDGAIDMAARHRDLVERGLRLKKTGNQLMTAVGGRAIHPINVRVGGFYRAPAPSELSALLDPLRQALDDAIATVGWVAGFDFPDFEHDHELLALVREGTYAIEHGVPHTDRGLVFPVSELDHLVLEHQVPHSTALHATLAGRDRYLTGPVARYALSGRWLSPLARQAAAEAGLPAVCRNPFQSIVVRAVELVYAIEEAIALIEAYEPPHPPVVHVDPAAGVGYGATEAPRGTLFHRYDLDDRGVIRSVRIVPPTSQNQASIEDDLLRFVATRLDYDDARLTSVCEQVIRNYDPCISCATHFLTLDIHEGELP